MPEHARVHVTTAQSLSRSIGLTYKRACARVREGAFSTGAGAGTPHLGRVQGKAQEAGTRPERERWVRVASAAAAAAIAAVTSEALLASSALFGRWRGDLRARIPNLKHYLVLLFFGL